MKVAIYNRYWHVLGGGEKYAGSVAHYLGRFGAVDLVSHTPFSVEELEKRFGLDLKACRQVILPGYPERHAEEASRDYDLWVNCSYQSSVRSYARRSLLLVFFPTSGPLLLRPVRNLSPHIAPIRWNEWLWSKRDFWRSYHGVLAISDFTAEWIRRWWGAEPGILYPPVDLIGAGAAPKTRSIITVGRFFVGGHSKRQDVLIENFKELCDRGLDGWEFHLCGGSQREPWNRRYLRNLHRRAEGYPIKIHVNIPRKELDALYRSASIYWHAAGYGLLEEAFPHKMEHFGITTVEAMSARCIPIVFDRGGQREIVDHGRNGYRWGSAGELKRWTLQAAEQQESDAMRDRAASDARGYSNEAFFAELEKVLATVGEAWSA